MIIRSLAFIGAFTIFGLLAACFSDSNANNDDAAAIAALEERLAKAEALIGADRMYAQADGASAKGSSKLSSANLADIGQFMSYDRHGYSLEYATFTSTPGYKAIIRLGIPGDNYLEPPTAAPPVFSGTGCTGDVYVSAHIVSRDTALSGLVFSIGTEYFAIPAGSSVVNDISYLSRIATDTGQCEEVASTLVNAYHAVPNDPAVTGFQNDPYAGPIRAGS